MKTVFTLKQKSNLVKYCYTYVSTTSLNKRKMNAYFSLSPRENTDEIEEYFATTHDLSLRIALTQTDDL